MTAFLYPDIEPWDQGWLDVSDRHRVWYEQSGNPQGRPVIFLHGGPGGGCSPKARGFFDPARYRIILMDQRGAGRSTPSADLVDNTTWHLVEDLETLRRHLGIERWVVFGGSWGSTLALAYAQTHPQSVLALILRGIFMLRRSELLWFYQSGADQLYPDAYEQYLQHIPPAERGDLMSAYYRRLTHPDRAVQLAAARAWAKWEARTSFLRPEPAYVIGRIRQIPAVIVQGRYDVVCPMRSAWDLHRAWPEADLVIVQDAGHSAFEPGIGAELRKAADRFAG